MSAGVPDSAFICGNFVESVEACNVSVSCGIQSDAMLRYQILAADVSRVIEYRIDRQGLSAIVIRDGKRT